MTMCRALLVIFALAVPSGALGQLETQPWAQATPDVAVTPDVPPGYPYNVGTMAQSAGASTDVPLRDYISSRLDQLRVEMLDRIEQQRDIIDERDRQYAQRFAAQQEALSAALLAAEKAVANALAAAKEAVIKAENAANDRFDGVNEMRAQLDDQARNFVTKETFEAKFEALDVKIALAMENIGANGKRIDAITSKGEGASSTWALVAGAIGFIVLVGGFLMNYSKHRTAA